MLIKDRVSVDLGVDHGKILQRHARGLHEERHEREFDAMLLLDALLEALSYADHRRHVDLVERREVSGRVLRLQQMLGDAPPARRHLLACFAVRGARGEPRWARCGRRRRGWTW